MSMIRCLWCDVEKDSDVFEFENVNGEDVCVDCITIKELVKGNAEMEDIVGVNHPAELGEI